MSEWTVVAEPVGENPGRVKKAAAEAGVGNGNVGGMVIYLIRGGSKQEVSRVAWVRRNSKNPKTSFEKQFAAELDKARGAAATLNGFGADGGLA